MIELPPSKSIGARFMVATFFAGTLPADPYFEDNDDLLDLQQALLEVFSDEEPIDYGDSPIDVGASGTALRFLSAVCASTTGADYVITGTPRLMERPMTPLLNLLKEAGAGIEALGSNNTGPYRVVGKKLKGGNFSIQGNVSSQFISAVMLVAPYWENGVNLSFATELVSRPYVEMTAKLMQKFGIKVKLSEKNVKVDPGNYSEPLNFNVEADWSSASFFYEAAALGAENVEIANLTPPSDSLQGDAVTAEIFKKLGVVSNFKRNQVDLNKEALPDEKIELDFKDCPDLVLPFAIACLLTDVKFNFTGVANLRLKESDRLKSLQDEARKLGFDITTGDDNLTWDGKKVDAETDPVINPHDDHRVAMAFAMAALKTGKIKISDPDVVEKSFNDFWNQIPKVGLNCVRENNIMTVELK